MRSKRLELQEALKKQKPSTKNRQEALQNQRSSTKKPRSASFSNGRLANEVVTDVVDERLNGRRTDEIVTDAVDERLKAVALEKQCPSTTKPNISLINGRRGKNIVTERPNTAVLEKLRSSTTKACAAIVNASWENEFVNIAVDARLNAVAHKKQTSSATKSRSALGNVRRAKKIVTDAVDERLKAVSLEKQTSSVTKSRSAFVNDQMAKEVVTDAVDERFTGRRANGIVTDAVDERLNVVALKKQKSSATKPPNAFVDEFVTDAVDERLNAFDKQSSAVTKPWSAFINGRRAKEIVTDAVVGERLNAIALEKQKSLTIKPRISFVIGRRAKEIITDAVDERLNVAALEKQRSSTTKSCSAINKGRRGNEIVADAVDERINVVGLEKPKSPATKPFSAFANGRRAKETAIDVVDERLNVAALEKQRLSTKKSCSAINNGSWANEIASIAVEARLNAVALKKQRLSTTKPSSAFVDCSKASEIVTDPEDERLNIVADMLDAGSDTGDEDADTHDTSSNIRDEDADILDADGYRYVQIVEDQSLPVDSDEDADILDVDGNGDVQFAEDQSSPTDFDEDADTLDADGNGDMQILEDQPLPTNSENSSRKRKCEMVLIQVSDSHREFNNTNCTSNGQGSTSMPSVTRIPIIFDKYGRPCDVGSEEFVTDIGKIVRAHCRPAIESWKIVPNSIKDNIWKDIVARYVVPEVYKPNVLSRANAALRTWKQHLRRELDKYETVGERKIKIPWRLITKREDWESFVDFCNTDEDKKRRAAGRKAQEGVAFIQSCGRKGIYRKIYELEKESPTGEINRAAIFVDTHISKNIDDPKMRLVKELVEANPDGQKDIDNDAVALVCGRDAGGVVRGMGGGVSRTMIRASAASLEILRKVQQENKSLQSDIHLLRTQLGIHAPIHTSTPSNQSAPHTQNRASTPSNQPASHMQNLTSTPSIQFVSQAPEASNLPARSRLAHDASNLPARSRLIPLASNLPARSCLSPPASNLPSSSCFIKTFKGRTIGLGSFNTADPPMEHVYSLIIEEIFDRGAELFDKDGKLGDIMIGGVINWPKACVESNLPASSCFIRNFKRRIIAFGSFNTADPPMEHVYSIIVKEIYDREADLFDEDGKLGDIMIGGVINWPKACIKPC